MYKWDRKSQSMYGALNGGGTLVYTYCAHASGSLRCAEIDAEIDAEIACLVLEYMHVEDEGVLLLRLPEHRSQVIHARSQI